LGTKRYEGIGDNRKHRNICIGIA
jgi:hypothetical protein